MTLNKIAAFYVGFAVGCVAGSVLASIYFGIIV